MLRFGDLGCMGLGCRGQAFSGACADVLGTCTTGEPDTAAPASGVDTSPGEDS